MILRIRRRRLPEAGFTLLEIIVVLAVLGALATLVAPVVFRYIDDANVTRAQSDTGMIAAGINRMYRDTGRWPFYVDGDAALAHATADADILSSNAVCADGTCTDATLPTDGTGGSWDLTAAVKDSLRNQIITNTPFGSTSATQDYNTTGARAWKGPYVDRIPPTDPWGRSYLVNVGNADPAEPAATQKWVIVISAGPDGALETSASSLLASDAVPTGDDIIARVR